ncbi:MAG: sialidase [Actinomycetota bacterium]|nr:sialidase [Actinomycetota bacterium]
MHIRKRAWGTALAMSMITGASLIGLPAQPAAAAVANKGDIDLVVKRSEDGGKVWSESNIVIEGFGDTKGNRRRS